MSNRDDRSKSIKLIAKALKQGWNISEDAKKDSIDYLKQIITQPDTGRQYVRSKLMAIKALIAANGQDQALTIALSKILSPEDQQLNISQNMNLSPEQLTILVNALEQMKLTPQLDEVKEDLNKPPEF